MYVHLKIKVSGGINSIICLGSNIAADILLESEPLNFEIIWKTNLSKK